MPSMHARIVPKCTKRRAGRPARADNAIRRVYLSTRPSRCRGLIISRFASPRARHSDPAVAARRDQLPRLVTTFTSGRRRKGVGIGPRKCVPGATISRSRADPDRGLIAAPLPREAPECPDVRCHRVVSARGDGRLPLQTEAPERGTEEGALAGFLLVYCVQKSAEHRRVQVI